MAYDLVGRISLDDNFSKKIRSIERVFKGFLSEIRSAVDDVAAIGASAQETANEIADASRETRQLARRMNDAADETAQAAASAMALQTALAGVTFANLGAGGISTIATKIPLIVSGLSLATAVAGPLAAGVGGLASSFAAAGIGAAAFGVVAVGALSKVFAASEEVAKLEEKIASADTAKERIAAQKELAAVYEGMSTAQKGALKDLQSFKSFWGGFVKQFEEPIFEAFSSGLQFTEKLLTGLTRTIRNVSGVVNELMTGLNKSIDNGGFKDFFIWLEVNAAGAIRNFATIGGNLLSGLFSMFQAFSPVGASMEEGLVNLTQRFKEWAASLEGSNGFKNFIAYAKENGPVLMDTIGNVASVIKQMITDSAPLGTTVLSALKSITELISNNWPAIRETIVGITAAVVAYKVAMAGMAIVGVVTKLMASYRAVAGTMTIAQWALNAAMTANPVGLVIAAIAALIGIGVVLYRNWDKITKKAKELFGKLLNVKTSTLAMLGPFGLIVAAGIKVYKNWDKIKATAKDVFGAVKDWIGGLKDKWDSFAKAISKFKMPKFKLPSFFGGGSGVDGSHKTGLYSVKRNGYTAELHRGESVLTADQSDTLRKMGVLKARGDKPVLDTSALNSGATGTKTVSKTTSDKPSVTIEKVIINGVNMTMDEIAREFVDKVAHAYNLGVT